MIDIKTIKKCLLKEYDNIETKKDFRIAIDKCTESKIQEYEPIRVKETEELGIHPKRESMTFFALTREHAEKNVKKIKHQFWLDTGKRMKGRLHLADEQIKHSSGWKTWEL